MFHFGNLTELIIIIFIYLCIYFKTNFIIIFSSLTY